jgi:hypothetical protein
MEDLVDGEQTEPASHCTKRATIRAQLPAFRTGGDAVQLDVSVLDKPAPGPRADGRVVVILLDPFLERVMVARRRSIADPAGSGSYVLRVSAGDAPRHRRELPFVVR